MQNDSILKGSNACEVKNLVLLYHKVKVIKKLIFGRQLKIKFQATKGRIKCGPFTIGLFHVKPQSKSPNLRLQRANNNATVRVYTLRECFNTIIISQIHVNQTALVWTHGPELHISVLAASTGSGRRSQSFELLALAMLIALDINGNRITETKLAEGDSRQHQLQRIQSASTTANQNCKVITANDIKDNLTLVTLVFVDLHTMHIKETKNFFKRVDSSISYMIEFFIGKLFVLIFLNFCILLRSLLFKNILFRHYALPCSKDCRWSMRDR